MDTCLCVCTGSVLCVMAFLEMHLYDHTVSSTSLQLPMMCNSRKLQAKTTWSKAMTVAAFSFLVARRGALGFTPMFGHRQFVRGATRQLSSITSAIDEAQLMRDMLYRVRSINQMPDDVRASALDFTVDGVTLGKVGCFRCVSIPTNFSEFLSVRWMDILRKFVCCIIFQHCRLCQVLRRGCARPR